MSLVSVSVSVSVCISISISKFVPVYLLAGWDWTRLAIGFNCIGMQKEPPAKGPGGMGIGCRRFVYESI